MKTAKFEATRTTVEGKPAAQFAVRNVSVIEGLSAVLEKLGFRFVIQANAATKTVTDKADAVAISAAMKEFFNVDGSAK